MRTRVWLILVLLAAGLSACGSKPLPVMSQDGRCIGLADDLKTLQVGDELPRVVQVLGMPNKAYRAYGFIGRSYDVLEYKLGKSPCARALLHLDENLKVVFDNKGEYVGSGGEDYIKFYFPKTLRTEVLVIDPVVLRP